MVSGSETFYFCQALAERARNGVKVNIILDGIGSKKLGKVCTDILVNSGCELNWYRKFTPLRLYHINNRDHRKFLIVDGKIGFTGGAGYANAWMGNASYPDEWRDTMYKVTGTGVADMQHIFSNNWEEITGQKISGPDYFPNLTHTGNMSVQNTMGAPYERGDTLGASYLLAIDAAKKSILIEHAYFAPNKRLRYAIKQACARGVNVKVIVPGDPIDSKILREASKIYWRELMKAGVEVYEYQTSMMHGKLIVIDDYLTIAGSGNFDERTLFINDEANLHVLSESLATEQKAMFYRDLKNCKRMTPKDAKVKWKPVDLFNRISAYLVMPQL
jgi:cardiolipin synthase A/B